MLVEPVIVRAALPSTNTPRVVADELAPSYTTIWSLPCSSRVEKLMIASPLPASKIHAQVASEEKPSGKWAPHHPQAPRHSVNDDSTRQVLATGGARGR